MAGEDSGFFKVPQEAKSVNEFMIWAGKHGQAETAQQLIQSVQNHDWSSASKAFDKLDDYAKATDAAKELGSAMSTFENMGKVIEVAGKVENGDYFGAGVQAGAEIIDATASKFLQEQGPGGIALDYLAHKSGEELAEKLHEYQGFKDLETLSQADINAASAASWKHEREFVEAGVRERIEAGQSPEEASAWARDHIESHGAIYRDLEKMDGNFGDATQDRQITDQLWIVDRANEIAHEHEEAEAQAAKETQSTDGGSTDADQGGFFSDLWNQGVDAIKEVFQPDVDEEETEPPTEATSETEEPEVNEPEIKEPEVTQPDVVEKPAQDVPQEREAVATPTEDHDFEIVINNTTIEQHIHVVEATSYNHDTVNVDASTRNIDNSSVDQSQTHVDQSADHSQTYVDQSTHLSQTNIETAPVAAEVVFDVNENPPVPTEIDVDTYEIPLPTEVNVDEVFVTTAEQWDDDIAAMANAGTQPQDLTVAEHDVIVHSIAEGEPLVFEAQHDVEGAHENSYEDFSDEEETYTA